MSHFFYRWIFIGLIWAWLGAGNRLEAQNFGLSVSNSASSLQVSNSLSYTINVTNLTGAVISDVMVSNVLPASVQLSSYYISPPGTFTNYSTISNNIGAFDLGVFAVGQSASLILTVQPMLAGYITNTVTVWAFGLTNTVSTNSVTLVTNLIIQADLGVTMTGSAQPVITNDWVTYSVSAFNNGPNTASGILLTNAFSSDVILRGISPTNQPFSIISNNLVVNLGTLTNGGSINLQFTVQPIDTGVSTFFAAIGAPNVTDPNITNNLASTNILVMSYSVGTLIAVTNSGQAINLQNGLEEQSILLSNLGPNDVAAARVVVTSLPKQLFNAVGTNNGNPFVTLGAPLAAGKSVSLLLQYNPRGSFLFTNGQLHAFAVPLPNWTPPTVTSTSTNINISRIVQLTNGNLLLEWPAITNRTYSVVYSDNVLFSNAMLAPPAIVAPANEIQWIDYGPPATISAPTNASARFYRVFLNP